MRSSRELPSHLRANIESMMVGEPIILLSHGLKANTEDCRLLDDLACAPITDLSDDSQTTSFSIAPSLRKLQASTLTRNILVD